MEFVKYPKIEQATSKNVAYLKEMGATHFLVEEKLHGANICLIIGHDGYEVASRNRIIPDGEDFYGVKDFLENSETANALEVRDSISILRAGLEEGQAIYLYGELIGPGIQKGVDYGPDKKIFFFDVYIRSNQEGASGWLPPGVLKEPIPSLTVPVFDVYEIDNISLLRALMDLSPMTRLTIQNWGHRNLGANSMEGVVLKPMFDGKVAERLPYLKIKTPGFKEVERKPKKAPQKFDSDVEGAKQELSNFLTWNRLEGVFSKEGRIDSYKDIGKFVKLVLDDAKEDFLKERPDVLEWDKGSQRHVFNQGKTVASMLKQELEKGDA